MHSNKHHHETHANRLRYTKLDTLKSDNVETDILRMNHVSLERTKVTEQAPFVWRRCAPLVHTVAQLLSGRVARNNRFICCCTPRHPIRLNHKACTHKHVKMVNSHLLHRKQSINRHQICGAKGAIQMGGMASPGQCPMRQVSIRSIDPLRAQ